MQSRNVLPCAGVSEPSRSQFGCWHKMQQLGTSLVYSCRFGPPRQFNWVRHCEALGAFLPSCHTVCLVAEWMTNGDRGRAQCGSSKEKQLYPHEQRQGTVSFLVICTEETPTDFIFQDWFLLWGWRIVEGIPYAAGHHSFQSPRGKKYYKNEDCQRYWRTWGHVPLCKWYFPGIFSSCNFKGLESKKNCVCDWRSGNMLRLTWRDWGIRGEKVFSSCHNLGVESPQGRRQKVRACPLSPVSSQKQVDFDSQRK